MSIYMSKIEVYRTHTEIHNYELGDSKKLERTFSIFDRIRHQFYPLGMYYNPDTKTLYIPRGYSIGHLEDMFCTDARVITTCDPFDQINQMRIRYKPRDEVQMEALQFMLSKGRYVNNANHPMLSLNLNTGKGKTYCSITAVSCLGLRSMVITYSTNWLEQWRQFFLEYTDISSDEIYYISGTPGIMKLFNRDMSKYKVILCTHSTIREYANKYGWEAIHDLFNYMRIGVKIYDEAHLNFDNMFMIDCFTNTWLTYYVTATPNRSNEDEDNIYAIYFQNVPFITLFDKDSDPHTSYTAIRYNSRPNPIQISECKNAYGMDRSKYVSYLVEQENFYKVLRILLDMALRKGGKHLYYIGTNEAILKVKQWIYNNYPELVGQVGIYTSIIDKEQRKNELDKMIILSTTKSAGAAEDIPGLVETVVLAEPFKSKVLAQQTFGRTRAEDTSYKEIVDNGFYFTKRFFDAKKPVFKKYATDCKEVTLRDDELDRRNREIVEKRKGMISPIEFFEKV
jgi:superfamily II DNA or RNA helicase